MTRIIAAFWAFALLTASPLQAQDAETSLIPADEASALQASLDRGQDMYLYDQAAWHTSDALLEDIPDPSAAGVRGWVVTEVKTGHQVTYWKPAGDSFEAVYSAVYDGKAVADRTIHNAASATLSELQLSLIRAGQVPNAGELTRCSNKPFNTVIMPSRKNNGSIYVYYLVPQSTLSEIPLGGHFRFEVLDGEVVGERKFTNSCISLGIPKAKGGKTPAGLVVSHLLDPIPTEIHVFSTYAAKLPIFVMASTSDQLWSVEINDGEPSASLIER